MWKIAIKWQCQMMQKITIFSLVTGKAGSQMIGNTLELTGVIVTGRRHF